MTDRENVQPVIGKLLIVDNSKTDTLRLLFVDEAPDPQYPESWPHMEIALMDTFEEEKGVEVYTGIEAGMIHPKYISREATDEDITKIVKTKLETEGDLGIGNLANWFNGLMTEVDCAPLLAEEKERINSIIQKVILENKGEEGLTMYKPLVGLPYKMEG